MLAALAAVAAVALGLAQAAPTLADDRARQSIDASIGPEAPRIAAAAPLPRDLAARRAAFDKRSQEIGGAPETVMRVEDSMAGDVPIRLYRPGEGRVSAMVYTHGGGFDKGGLDSHDAALRLLANRCHCVIVAVDYRLAPEHRYPAQIDDAHAVLRWAAANAKSLEILPDRFVVGGDGVGGNLAALLALRARNEGGPKIIYQALFYPVTDLSSNADRDSKVLRAQYLPAGLDAKDPRVSPLHANLRGLPPAFVAIAELDGHRDDGQAFAAKLRDAGVPAEAKIYAGQAHDFLLMSGKAKEQLLDDVAARLRQTFGYVE